MKQIKVRLDEELAERIDSVRGEVPRERWIRAALRAALAGEGVEFEAQEPVTTKRGVPPEGEKFPTQETPEKAGPRRPIRRDLDTPEAVKEQFPEIPKIARRKP
jgi:hypothetical protein